MYQSLTRDLDRVYKVGNIDLNALARKTGLTCFEQEFVARCRARLQQQQPIPRRELPVLEQIWKRHGGPQP